ncbi:uncharacterized protein ALTATR162_LOCUS12173 [Alternaria atra]|uniref:Heterokaryon incompatibility domain-containing protein n=1 Tax=Alternaria atra TaxID=119953 RepID=A0A8J2ICV3_9PLEO|nr:uncharacterized protein ALTATR162_LOCUS12173 [Alternaria atra]CAG5190318.1 unnamed protein product [Alternaria atra]
MSSSPESRVTSAPSFDTFYSPKNVSFYASKPYTSLSRHDREIRLIRVFPGARDDPVVCELLPPEPLLTAKYLALSYCAGDPSVTSPITVSGLQFNAFASLEAALRRLRLSPDDYDEERPPALLWTDQICIDQSDPSERAHQVGLMRDLYGRAGRVMVWLGEEGRGGAGLQWLDGQYGNIEHIVTDIDLEIKNHDDEETLGAIDYVSDLLGKTLAEEHFEDPELIEAWMGVRDIVFSPWWGRCWVAQELIVSRNAVIMFGDVTMFWDDFKVAYTVVRSFVRAVARDLLTQSRDVPFSEQKVEHCKSMIGNWKTDIDFMIDQQTEWMKGNSIPMKILLRHARHAQSSDPRDKIYAFLGLGKSGYSIIPDYDSSNSVTDAHCHATKQIILYDGDLGMLNFAQNHDTSPPDLPSWTPFWCLPNDRLSITVDQFHEYDASASRRAIASFHPDVEGRLDRVLRVAGVVIDQVATGTIKVRRNGGHVREDLNGWLSTIDIDLDNPSHTSRLYFTGENITAAILSTMHLGQQELSESSESVDEFEAKRVRIRAEHQNRRLQEVSTDEERCFFFSPNGCIGIANGKPLHTDVLTVLLGGTMPFILRKIGNQYKLVCEAYVHGFMHGRAIDMIDRGELKLQNFDII